MQRRPRGGDDRRTWLIAAAGSLAIVVAVAVLVVLLVVPRGTSSRVPVASAPAPAGAASGTAAPTPGSSAAVTPATATPLPPPLSGSDDSGPALVGLDDPTGPVDVARQLFGGGTSCGSAHATYTADCAVTHRFGVRLVRLYGAGQPYEPLCRCEAAWSAVAFGIGDPGPQGDDGNHAAVTASFTIAGRHLSLTVLVERTTSGWLANDTWCGTDRAQDMYVAQPQGCPPM